MNDAEMREEQKLDAASDAAFEKRTAPQKRNQLTTRQVIKAGEGAKAFKDDGAKGFWALDEWAIALTGYCGFPVLATNAKSILDACGIAVVKKPDPADPETRIAKLEELLADLAHRHNELYKVVKDHFGHLNPKP